MRKTKFEKWLNKLSSYKGFTFEAAELNKNAIKSVIYAFDLNTDPNDLTKWLFLSVITS